MVVMYRNCLGNLESKYQLC